MSLLRIISALAKAIFCRNRFLLLHCVITHFESCRRSCSCLQLLMVSEKVISWGVLFNFSKNNRYSFVSF
jgi:hypothetical protein